MVFAGKTLFNFPKVIPTLWKFFDCTFLTSTIYGSLSVTIMMPPNNQFGSDTSSGDMYVDNRYMYSRNSRAIGVLWAVFSLCFAIINAVVFVQPQWLGDTVTSRGTGYFGLWRSCRLLQDGQDLICEGRLDDFSTIQTPAFLAATVFMGLSVCISSLCVLAMVLFFFMHSSTVFHVCGWMQLSCGK